MISEEFPKSSPNKKVLGDRDRFPLLCALLYPVPLAALGVTEIFTLFLRDSSTSAPECQLGIHFPIHHHGCVGTQPGTALACVRESHPVAPFQELKTLSILFPGSLYPISPE